MVSLRAAAVTAVLVTVALLSSTPSSAFDPNDPSLDPEKGTLAGSPMTDLPPYIRRVLPTGMRPDWSPDGRGLIYTDAPLGNVWRLDLRTKKTTNLTGRFPNHGYLRAYSLHSGDILLCGPDKTPRNADSPEAGRFDGKLFVFQKPFTRKPVPLGRPCWEGQAVSHRSDRIAWNESTIDFTNPDQQFLVGKSEIWTGDIVKNRRGTPRLAHVKRVATRQDIGVKLAPIEVQDFRGPDEHELLLTAYGALTGEVYGYDMRTGAATDYSGYSPFYEEAEGAAHSGRFDVVERDLMVNPIPGTLDLWRLELDGSATFRRLTHFNRHKGYGASNPVVSPDDRMIAFQMSVSEGAEGEGAGIFVLDIDKALADTS
jgi:hypothetical protein